MHFKGRSAQEMKVIVGN